MEEFLWGFDSESEYRRRFEEMYVREIRKRTSRSRGMLDGSNKETFREIHGGMPKEILAVNPEIGHYFGSIPSGILDTSLKKS